MAVTETIVFTDGQKVIADIEATADADVAFAFAHGLGEVPRDVTFLPLQAEYFVSTPTLGVVDATNINGVMANAVGSGVAGAQIRVIARVTPEPW